MNTCAKEASLLFTLPLELWDESLLPRMSRNTVLQLSMTCRAMRWALSRRAFQSVWKIMPTFAPAGHASTRGRKCLLKLLASDFEMFAVSPAAAHVRTLQLLQRRRGVEHDGNRSIAAVGEGTWSGLALELVLPHLSSFSLLKRLELSDVTLTHEGVCAVLSLTRLEALSLQRCMLELDGSLSLEQPVRLRSFYWNSSAAALHFDHLLTAIITDSLDELILYRVDEMILEVLKHAAPLTAVSTLTLEMAQHIPVDLISFLPTTFPNLAHLRIDEWLHLPPKTERNISYYFPLMPGSFALLDHIHATRTVYVELILDLHPLTRVTLTPLIGRECEEFLELTSRRPSLQQKMKYFHLVLYFPQSIGWRATMEGIFLNCLALESLKCSIYLPPSESDGVVGGLLDQCTRAVMTIAIREITITLHHRIVCFTVFRDRCTSLLRRLCYCHRLEYFMIETVSKGAGRCAFTYDRAIYGQLHLKTVEEQYGLLHEHEL